MSVPLDSRLWDSSIPPQKITIITMGSSSGEHESSWSTVCLPLRRSAPGGCCTGLALIAPAHFLRSACQISWTLKPYLSMLFIYIYSIWGHVCVLMWETQHTVNDVWFENYKAPAASPPLLSFQPSPEFFHTGCLGLRDPAVIRVFRTLLTVFALYPTVFQTQEHQALIWNFFVST